MRSLGGERPPSSGVPSSEQGDGCSCPASVSLGALASPPASADEENEAWGPRDMATGCPCAALPTAPVRTVPLCSLWPHRPPSPALGMGVECRGGSLPWGLQTRPSSQGPPGWQEHTYMVKSCRLLPSLSPLPLEKVAGERQVRNPGAGSPLQPPSVSGCFYRLSPPQTLVLLICPRS